MEKLFKWEIKPNGNCPVQSSGWFMGYYFYFRARGSFAAIEFYKNKEEFYTSDALKSLNLKKTDDYKAGWLSKRFCKLLIYKGCLIFLLSYKSNNGE